jgi:4-amino-4-deoxy-L-arabinose transferase-like glycosyltransferase
MSGTIALWDRLRFENTRGLVIIEKTAISYQRAILVALLIAAVLVRIGVRVAFGEEYFWANSYGFYYPMAENIVSGAGFSTNRPPLYPLFLAITTLTGNSYWLIIVPQALMGAGTALCAFLIGRHLFGSTAGLLACSMSAFYPYYVAHDTALQETGMATFGMALSVWLLLRAKTLDRNWDWILAGLSLGLVTLVSAKLAPAAVAALVWTGLWGAQGDLRSRLKKSLIILLTFSVTLAPWLIETYRLTGAPVLTSRTGYSLWVGNNPETFSHYPIESIDRSAVKAWGTLTAADRADLQKLAHDEVAMSNWFGHRARAFIESNPRLVVQRAFHKLEAGFSWRLNPKREALAQTAYALGYVPVIVLGIVGMVLARRKREVLLIGLLFLAFMGVTAVFWAHTSHRTHLDVYLMVFAASVLVVVLNKARSPYQNRRRLISMLHGPSR